MRRAALQEVGVEGFRAVSTWKGANDCVFVWVEVYRSMQTSEACRYGHFNIPINNHWDLEHRYSIHLVYNDLT